MANALRTLFSDIANAIRNKTGYTEKMSPKDFPIYINNISVNSGGGDSDTKEWKLASGVAIGTGGAITIRHELGIVPDIVYVKVAKSTEDTIYFVGALQFSDAMTEAIGYENARGIAYGMGNIGLVTFILQEGINNENPPFADLYGHIRNANAISFTVGGGSVTPIAEGREIAWWAVGGIT
jgi:hypothetical protein